MFKLFLFCIIFVVVVVAMENNDTIGEELEEEEEEETGFGGLLNGLLETFTKPSSPSPTNHTHQLPCPGRCISPLASVFMCDKTLENAICDPGNYVCCHDDVKNATIKEVGCSGACVDVQIASQVCSGVGEGVCPGGSVCCGKKKKEIVKSKCAGTCRNMIFGLFLCDEIDSEGVCPEGGQACCVNRKKGNDKVVQGGEAAVQGGEEGEVEESSEEVESSTTTTTTTIAPKRLPPQRQPPQRPQPPPPCHAYCVALPALPYCRAPLPGTCGINAGCCGHDLQPVLRPVSTTTTTTTTPDYDEVEKTNIAVEACPGQCIRPIMSFTCFLNAEMTDAFRCEDEKMKCCAPKKNVLNTTATTPPSNVVNIQSYNPSPKPLPLQPLQPLAPPPLVPQKIDRNFQASRYICGVKGGVTLGNNRRKRVVGGEDALPGEWCWQVALINSMNQYLCGGALIGVEWVLTAAHCVTNIVRSGDSIYIRVGDHDLTSKYGSPGAQTLRVATTYIHHNHNSQTLDNDIALLKLQGQVQLKEGVCLICLPSRSGTLLPGRRCTVTGYGYMGESGPIPLRVREAELPIVSDSECIRKVNAVTEKPFVLPVSSFCAGGEFKNDACQGDGGGPLVCREDDYYELTGLVSWGFGCGRKDVPGVYVKISSFIGWINQIISIAN